LEVHNKRFTLAGEAPICNRTLFKDVGYTATTPATPAILNGTYKAPPDTDYDTKELFAKIALICHSVPENSVTSVIAPIQWKKYWTTINKETSSSESGLHL
jgi:hypothetical protein